MPIRGRLISFVSTFVLLVGILDVALISDGLIRIILSMISWSLWQAPNTKLADKPVAAISVFSMIHVKHLVKK